MNTRKDFLITASLAALAPAAAQAASPAPSASPKRAKEPELRFDFDQVRFNQILAKPATHRQCFGATKIDGGNVIDAMANTRNAYVDYLSEPGDAVHTVAVLYHGTAIALAFNDTVWNEFFFPVLKGAPKKLRDEFEDAKPGKGNPYRQDVAGAVAQGASFFVCHNAIAGFSHLIAGALKRSAQVVHAALMAGMLPGALAVPAGVMAINACQEAKFTYIQSSL